MAVGAIIMHDRAKFYTGNNTINLSSDTIECRLYNSTSNIHELSRGDATTATGELSGNGYAAQVVTPSWTQNGSISTFDTTNPAFTASGGSLTFRYIAWIDTTTTPDEILGHAIVDDTPGDITINDTDTYTYQTNAAGVFRFN